MATDAIELASLESLPRDDRLFEFVDGLPQDKVSGSPEVNLMSLLGIYLGHFARVHLSGRVHVEMLVDFGLTESSKFQPDVEFVSYERWPKDRMNAGPRTEGYLPRAPGP